MSMIPETEEVKNLRADVDMLREYVLKLAGQEQKPAPHIAALYVRVVRPTIIIDQHDGDRS